MGIWILVLKIHGKVLLFSITRLLDVCLYFEGVGYTCNSFEKEDIHVEGSGVFFVVVFFIVFWQVSNNFKVYFRYSLLRITQTPLVTFTFCFYSWC